MINVEYLSSPILKRQIEVYNKYENRMEKIEYYYLDDGRPDSLAFKDIDARHDYEIKLCERYNEYLNNIDKENITYENIKVSLTKKEYNKIVQKQIIDEWESIIYNNNDNNEF
jgi:hypothetical protein